MSGGSTHMRRPTGTKLDQLWGGGLPTGRIILVTSSESMDSHWALMDWLTLIGWPRVDPEFLLGSMKKTPALWWGLSERDKSWWEAISQQALETDCLILAAHWGSNVDKAAKYHAWVWLQFRDDSVKVVKDLLGSNLGTLLPLSELMSPRT